MNIFEGWFVKFKWMRIFHSGYRIYTKGIKQHKMLLLSAITLFHEARYIVKFHNTSNEFIHINMFGNIHLQI